MSLSYLGADLMCLYLYLTEGELQDFIIKYYF